MAPPLTPEQSNAFAIVTETLRSYGLESLSQWVIRQVRQARSAQEILLALQNRPEFKARFPEIEEMRKQGLQPWSPAQILDYRTRAAHLLRSAGVPEEFFDDPVGDFRSMIVGGVSLVELTDKVNLATTRVLGVDPLVRDSFANYFGPRTDQALFALFLDPERGAKTLERMVTQAEIGGAGTRFGFDVGADLATRLAQSGVDRQAALGGFGAADRIRGLATETFAETDDITDDDVVEGTFGVTQGASERLRRRGAQRVADFSGGGGVTGDSGGLSFGGAD